VAEGDDLLVWIGYHYYPTIGDFIEEATEHGVLKKVRSIPKGFEAGKTRVFLAHNEGFEGLGVIIGYCTPEIIDGKPGSYPKRKDNGEPDDPSAKYLSGTFEALDHFVNIKGESKTKRLAPLAGDAILASKCFTSSPSSRAMVPGKDQALRRPKSAWTDEDREALLNLVKQQEGQTNTAFREFSVMTGRSLRSVEYQWYGPMKKKGMR